MMLSPAHHFRDIERKPQYLQPEKCVPPPYPGPVGAMWFIRDGCGIACAIVTWFLVLYAEFVVLFVMLIPSRDYVYSIINGILFNLLAFLALASHCRAMLTDPVSMSGPVLTSPHSSSGPGLATTCMSPRPRACGEQAGWVGKWTRSPRRGHHLCHSLSWVSDTLRTAVCVLRSLRWADLGPGQPVLWLERDRQVSLEPGPVSWAESMVGLGRTSFAENTEQELVD